MPTNAINDTGVKYVYDKLDAKKVDKEAGKGLSTNDYSNADKSKVDKIDETTTSISGNPISIPNLKANQLAKNPIITLEPIQAGSGTPSPSNIRAISGYDKIEVLSCGVNVWDEVWELGELNAQGQNASSTTKIRSKNYIPVVGGSTYYLKLSSASAQVFICFYDVNKTFISSNSPYQGTFTVPLMARYCRFNCPATYGTTYNNDMGINYPAAQTSYVSSNKTTDLSESLGQTVYGLTDDVRSGLCTDIWTKIDASTLSWGYNGTQKRYEADLPNAKSVGSGRSDKIVCSKYATDVDAAAGDSWKVFQSGRTVFVYDNDRTGNPTGDIAYILADVTIQLTPHEISLLKDYAYLSTNGTNIQFDYHNGELASLGDVSQLGETVNELGDRLTAIPKRNEQINITSYNSTSNRFTVPTDGYITCHMPTSGNNYIRVGIYDKDAGTIGITQVNKADVDNVVGIFVKKGMLAMISMPSGAGGDAWFRGIDYVTP